MKTHITFFGDSNVGLSPIDTELDWPEDFDDDGFGEERRDAVRKGLSECIGEIWDGSPCGIRFDDECPDCGTRLDKGKCTDPKCVSNEPEENR